MPHKSTDAKSSSGRSSIASKSLVGEGGRLGGLPFLSSIQRSSGIVIANFLRVTQPHFGEATNNKKRRYTGEALVSPLLLQKRVRLPFYIVVKEESNPITSFPMDSLANSEDTSLFGFTEVVEACRCEDESTQETSLQP